ncbi:MAG TPA: SdrD B-like domain-containing protein [Gemmataceae bacterium]|jgi:hypothetical protein
MSPYVRRRPTHTVRLSLRELEDRLVPSGTVLDLTAHGSSGTINGAIFQQSDAQPTGSGVIHSFVRLQTNAATEQGYNTDGRPLQFDENKSPVFTRSLQVGDVPLVSVGGVLYREFLLDVNQKASAPLISLDQLRVYVGDTPDATGYDATTRQLAGLDAVYDLDAGGDNWVKLNYRLNSGSGSGDMTVLIPASLLGSDPGRYVYLYSAFGENQAANSGFEEWSVRVVGGAGGSSQPPPQTALSSLSGFVYFDANQNGVFDAGEAGIAGVTVTLTGVDDLGRNVVLVARTDVNGFYHFDNLRQGIYSLLEDQPSQYQDGADTIGTQGGQVDNDRFFDIFLAAGVDGRQNNFGEVLFSGS